MGTNKSISMESVTRELVRGIALLAVDVSVSLRSEKSKRFLSGRPILSFRSIQVVASNSRTKRCDAD
jgi:hypothetical protein